MSEELLKAIVKLFAIVAKERITDAERSNVRDFLAIHLSHELIPEYMELFEQLVKETGSDYLDSIEHPDADTKEFVGDWANIMALCRLINQGLTKQQKIVLLLKLIELMLQDGKISERQSNLIFYIGSTIKITQEEIDLIISFLQATTPADLQGNHFLVVDNNQEKYTYRCKHIIRPRIFGYLFVLRIPGEETYFIKYLGNMALTLNGHHFRSHKTYVFPPGSTIRGQNMRPLFYSEVVSEFIYNEEASRLSFIARDISHTFRSGYKALHKINIAEEGGRLIGLMGVSGSGKSTLMSILNGMIKPSSGRVTINGLDVHTQQDELNGVIGYVPQDDYLIEELTVYENLYYAARLTFADHSKEQSHRLVMQTLKSLGLTEIKDLVVGNPLNKTISGGQRKRINIGLELLRKPEILFVDEPTSGLSSRDSVNIMDLLKELSLQGKMVFVVIHQPSSDIYKMFDTLIILDVGGYQIYYGNPEEALVYFKTMVNMVNKEQGACTLCGNINSELIFDIIEARVVDEYGKLTDKRKIPPEQWYELFLKHIKRPQIQERHDKLNIAQAIPSRFKQFLVFAARDVKTKLKNNQYLLFTFTEAPLLGFFLAFLVKYYETIDDQKVYLFVRNMNIPVYFFMAVIVALFMGLTLSAEELLKDRMILQRERFLHLSRMSYLVSKMGILLVISAIQTISFVLVAHYILEVRGMHFTTWMMLFSLSFYANVLGLIISSAFNSAVTVYILIPILIIPQLILSGVIINFENFNYRVTSEKHIPYSGDLIASRWAYEGLAVEQFTRNQYNRIFYPYDREINLSNYKRNYYIPELENQLGNVFNNITNTTDPQVVASVDRSLRILRNEIMRELHKVGHEELPEYVKLTRELFDEQTYRATKEFLTVLKQFYSIKSSRWLQKKDSVLNYWVSQPGGQQKLEALRNAYHNEKMAEMVENRYAQERVQVLDDGLRRKIYPIYDKPRTYKYFDLDTKFYMPEKVAFGRVFSTYWTNVVIIWIMTALLVVILYFDWLRKIVDGITEFREYRLKKFRAMLSADKK